MPLPWKTRTRCPGGSRGPGPSVTGPARSSIFRPADAHRALFRWAHVRVVADEGLAGKPAWPALFPGGLHVPWMVRAACLPTPGHSSCGECPRATPAQRERPCHRSGRRRCRRRAERRARRGRHANAGAGSPRVHVAAQQTLLLLTDPALAFGAGNPRSEGLSELADRESMAARAALGGQRDGISTSTSPYWSRSADGLCAARPRDSHGPRHHPRRSPDGSRRGGDPASGGRRPHYRGEQQGGPRLVRRNRTGMAGGRRQRTAGTGRGHADARLEKYQRRRRCIAQQRARGCRPCRRQHSPAGENAVRATNLSADRARRSRPGRRDPRARRRRRMAPCPTRASFGRSRCSIRRRSTRCGSGATNRRC